MAVYDVRHGSQRSRKKAMHCRVWLNGGEVALGFYADTKRGIVRRYKPDERGRPHIGTRHEIATEELRGKVVVRRMPRLRRSD
jgi:hypothetical protein